MNIKSSFPLFKNQKKLVYLDSAASTQKPRGVLDTMNACYTHHYANVHRGIYKNSETTTTLYEKTREKVKNFIHASSEKEIIFTKGTTESINMVAYTWGEKNIKENDEVVVTLLEHHANFIPWQQLCKRKKATLKVVPISDDGTVSLETFQEVLSKKTRLVAVTAVSNVLGVMLPLRDIILASHKVGAKVFIDAAQSIAHLSTDVQKLDCDFLAFSGHKMYGPTGVGVLYGKKEILESMPPFLFGGDMIKEVYIENSSWADIPYRFEAGTPPICEVIGLGAAIDFLQKQTIKKIRAHEKDLLSYAFKQLSTLDFIKVLGPKKTPQVSGTISFLVSAIHAHDVATLLDEKNIAIRVGHHCAQPLMRHFNIPATCRVSFGIYNSKKDVDALITGLLYVHKIFI